jgi:hypothetical protein
MEGGVPAGRESHWLTGRDENTGRGRGAKFRDQGGTARAMVGGLISSGGRGIGSGRARRGARAGILVVRVTVGGKCGGSADRGGDPAGRRGLVRPAMGGPEAASRRAAGARRATWGAAAAPAALLVTSRAVPRGRRRTAFRLWGPSVGDAFAAGARPANSPKAFPLTSRVSRECCEGHVSNGWFCLGAVGPWWRGLCHPTCRGGRELAAEAWNWNRGSLRSSLGPRFHRTEVAGWNHDWDERCWGPEGRSWRGNRCLCKVSGRQRWGADGDGDCRLGFDGGRNRVWSCRGGRLFARDVVAVRILGLSRC